MSRKLEIIIAALSLVLIAISLGYIIANYYFSQNSNIEMQSKLDDLNSNIIQLIPPEPIINFQVLGQKEFPGKDFFLYEISGYEECKKNILVPLQEEGIYERILIFPENTGKKTTNLRIKIKCDPNPTILASCIHSENVEIETENSLDSDAIFNIKEADSIMDSGFSIYYQKEAENRTCTIEYNSDDLDRGEKQILNVSYFLRGNR